MKKKYIFAEFIIVFVFLVIPPLLVNYSAEAEVNLGLTPIWYIAVQGAVALLLEVQFQFLRKKNETETDFVPETKKQKSVKKIITFLTWFSISLGILMLIYALAEGIYLLFPNKLPSIQGISPSLPSGFYGFANLFLTLLVASFFEEVLYRQFLPETLSLFIGEKRWALILMEFLVALIFAFSHRYEGILAVLVAFLSGIMLRVCRKKTGSVYAGFLAHLIYNSLMVLFLLLG